MRMIRKVLVMMISFALPTGIFYWLLNLMGHRIHSKARIGFSIIWLDGRLTLAESSRIGHLNVIRVDNVTIDKGGYIGKLNSLNGPFDLILAETGALGDGNKCSRATIGITYGKSVLQLGVLSKITANHRVDCTRSIVLGNYTTIAGHDSQLWTHAYYHDKKGPGRFRVDGDILIGDNVYIGSRCIINSGITIANNVVVGANCCVSKSLLTNGTYVSQPLRFIESQGEQDLRSKYEKIKGHDLCEEVYQKRDVS